MNQECIGLIGRNFVESAAIEDANPLNSICHMPLKRGQRAEYMSLIIGIVCLTTALTWVPDVYSSQPIQFGVVLWYGTVLIVAEVVRRICLLTEEILHLKTRYDNDLTQLLLQVFGTTPLTSSCAMFTFLLFCFSGVLHPEIINEINTHWPTSVGLIGIYHIPISVLKIHENLVDGDALLDKHLLAIGHGLAYSYYYGFLKIVLPACATTRGQVKSLRERALDFEDEKHITLASKKLLILIPDSCFCLPSFKDVAPYEIEDVETLEHIVINRGGVRGRSYSTTVYRVEPERATKPVYVMLEMPSILLPLYEMNSSGRGKGRLSSFERTQQAQAFYRVLSKLLDEDLSCRDMYEIIYYKDQTANLAEMIWSKVQPTTATIESAGKPSSLDRADFYSKT